MKAQKNTRVSSVDVPFDFDNMAYFVTVSVAFVQGTLLVLYGILNIVINKYFAGIPELVVGIFLFFFTFYVRRYKKRYSALSLVSNAIIVFLSIYLFVEGGIHNTGIFWCFSAPALFMSTRGIRRSIFWIVLHISILGIIYLLSVFQIVEIVYDGLESLVALIVYCIICYILFVYEITRNRYKREIRRLYGLMPICSFCKKVRDKNGSWHSVDDYLNRKANIDFSHSVCPECLNDHYPEYSNDKNNND